MVFQIFRPVVAYDGIDGAVQHPLAQGLAILARPEWRTDPECPIEPLHILFGVHQMGRGRGTRDLKPILLRLPNQVDACCARDGRQVQSPSRVFQYVQISGDPQRFCFTGNAGQSHFCADLPFVHHATGIEVLFQGNIGDGFAMHLAVGQCTLKHACFFDGRVVCERCRSRFAQVVHFRQLKSIAAL